MDDELGQPPIGVNMDFNPQNLANPFFLASLPSLNGNNCTTFFESLEAMGQLSNWSHPQMLVITKLKIEGQARELVKNTLNGKSITYTELKTIIVQHFSHTDTASTSIANLTSAVQGQNESCRDFSVRLEGLANKTNAPAEFRTQLKLSQFIMGLKPSIKSQVQIQNPPSFVEAVQLAQRVELSLESLHSTVNTVSTHTQIQDSANAHFVKELEITRDSYLKSFELLTKRIEELSVRVDNAQQIRQIDRSTNRDITCFYCNIRGHRMNDCRKRVSDQSRQLNGQNWMTNQRGPRPQTNWNRNNGGQTQNQNFQGSRPQQNRVFRNGFPGNHFSANFVDQEPWSSAQTQQFGGQNCQTADHGEFSGAQNTYNHLN